LKACAYQRAWKCPQKMNALRKPSERRGRKSGMRLTIRTFPSTFRAKCWAAKRVRNATFVSYVEQGFARNPCVWRGQNAGFLPAMPMTNQTGARVIPAFVSRFHGIAWKRETKGIFLCKHWKRRTSAPPGQYAVFIRQQLEDGTWQTHCVHGYVPPEGSTVQPYLYDDQNKCFTTDQQPGAVAVPVEAKPNAAQ